MQLFVIENDGEEQVVESIFVGFDVNAIERIKERTWNLRKKFRPPFAYALVDARGLRGVWRFKAERTDAHEFPTMTRVAERFRGEWSPASTPVPTLEPQEPWELEALRQYKARL